MEISSVHALIFLGTMIILLCIWIGELSKKITHNREMIHQLVGQREKTMDLIREIEKDSEELRKLIDNNDRQYTELLEYLPDKFREILTIIDKLSCINKPSESPNKACEETDEEDIDEENGNVNRGITGSNRGIYEWIFPSKGVTEENKPKNGEEYLVIGSVKGSDNIRSAFTSWNGVVFMPTEHSPFETYDPFENVYAYVRLPSPSDVMKEVVDIVAKNGGVRA